MDIPNFLDKTAEELPVIQLTTAEIDRLERTVKNMSNDEKKVVVKKIPTPILQNELSRRMLRDHEIKEDFKRLQAKMEDY